jgi:beta-lactamase regulating signal transducer with metallopeptidase domain
VIIDSLVADIIVKVTLVLAIAAVVARLLAARSAAARHHVWAVALAASLALPVLASVGPQWSIAMLPAHRGAARESGAAADSASGGTIAREIAQPVGDRAHSQATNIAEDGAPIAAPPTLIATPDAQRWTFSAAGVAASIWLSGALLVLLRCAFGTARVWWIARHAEPAETWVALANELAESLALERRVTYLSGPTDAMPMAFGISRACVLLPSDADQWPAARQRVVLLHELAHIKRRDCLTQLMAHVACAAYWFNPLVWVAARRLRAEREGACDDLVLAAGTRGSDYADHLLDIARSLRSDAWPTWSAVTMAHRSQLEGRLMAILNPALPRRSPTRATAIFVTTSAFIAVTTLAGLHPVARAAEPVGRADAVVSAEPVAHAEPAATPAAPAAPAPQGRPSSPAQPAPTPTPTPMATPAPMPMPAPMPAPLPQVYVDPGIDRPMVSIYAPSGVELKTPLRYAQAPPVTSPGVQPGTARGTGADPRVVTALNEALKDENKEVRRQALHALVQMRAPISPDSFLSMLKDTDPDVRGQAVFALGQQRDPKNVDLIVTALKDQNREVRAQATFALSQIRDARAVEPLTTALKDSDPEVRSQAAFALGQIRDRRAVDPLIAALKDSNAQVRSQAAFALGQIR